MYYNYTHGNQELTEILHLSRMDYLGRNWIVDVCEGKKQFKEKIMETMKTFPVAQTPTEGN